MVARSLTRSVATRAIDDVRHGLGEGHFDIVEEGCKEVFNVRSRSESDVLKLLYEWVV